MRIDLIDVRKRFGRVPALAGVSAGIASGQRVALIGPNGSGKSTLIRAIMGLIACEGEVRLDGQSPFHHRVRLAARMAYVPQAAPQLGATVAEVVRTVAQVRALPAGGIAAVAVRLGLDLDAVGSRPVRNLSGGMKQKLLIALALAARPALLILDEPTASLDAATRAEFFRLCETEARAATLLLCSHRLEEMRHLVGHVIALADGRVAFDDPVAVYLERHAVTVLEVHTDHSEQGDWLRARGFVKSTCGTWAKTLRRGEKGLLLQEVVARFGGGAGHVGVRDLDALDVAPARGA